MIRSAVLLATFLCCTPLGAAEPLDVPALLGPATQTVEATVFLVAPTAVYQRPLDEPAVRRVGCRYATVDPAAIGALFAVIRAADPQATPLFQQPDMRAAIHLAREDGARVDFFLQDNLGSKLPVIGVVETSSAGTLRSVPLTAGPTLMTDLRDWAARHGGVGDGSGCRPH